MIPEFTGTYVLREGMIAVATEKIAYKVTTHYGTGINIIIILYALIDDNQVL